MKESKVSIILLVGSATLAISAFGAQIALSLTRQPTAVENTLIGILLVLFSTTSGWFINRYYADDRSDERAVLRLVQILEGSMKIGLDRIEPSLRRGTDVLKALSDTTYGFDFFGIGGSKVIPKMFDGKSSLGSFVAKNNRETVRVLLLNPECGQIRQWVHDDAKAIQVRNDILGSLDVLADQKQRGRKVQVRLYDFTPPMRIQIVNKQRAYLCEYDPLTDGWDTPQLCFTRDASKPLIDSVISLYDYFWDHSKDFDHEAHLSSRRPEAVS
jgi:hypothetical protein